MRLGAWLLSKGKITEDQLRRALQHQDFFGGRLGSSLIKLGFVDEDLLGAYLSDISGTPYAPPRQLEGVPAEVLALVPARLAAQYCVVPIGVEGRRLRLAMRDPKDLIALDEIAFLTGMTIEPCVATDFRIQKALQRYYQVTSGPSAIPVAGASLRPASPPSPARGPAPAPTSPRATRPSEIGLDGYPLDADPEEIAGVADRARRAGGGEDDAPPPTSLEKWRQAQEEIPEEFPERAEPGASPTRAAASRPGAAAAPAAQASESPRPAALAPSTDVVDTLEAAAARLQTAETRDEVFDTLVRFAASRHRRCALFIVHADRVVGWGGGGAGIDASRVRQASVPLERPSLFGFLRSGSDHLYGPLSDTPATRRFFLDVGWPAPERALLMSLAIRGRPTVVLYADDAADPAPAPDIPMMRRLLSKATLALEILILRNKIATL